METWKAWVHPAMDQAAAAAVMMCLGPFIPAEHGLNTTAHESIVNMDSNVSVMFPTSC